MIVAFQEFWRGISIGEHLSWFSPEITLTLTMLAIVAAPIVLGRGAKTIGAIAALGCAVTFLMALRVTGMVADSGKSGLSTDPNAGILIVDNLSIFFKLVLTVFLGAVTFLWWMGGAEEERDAPEFFILLFGSALGMALMVSTTHLLMMVVAIETASLPSYAIVGFNKRDAKSAEASLKYMVFGAISAATMVYGVSLLYGLTGGRLGFADIANLWLDTMDTPNRLLTSVGLICVTVGIGFKISAVPFHFWCPDAFEGAKIEVTTWLSVVSKAAGLLLFVRLITVFCAQVDVPEHMGLLAPLAWGVGVLAMVTATWANFAAYRQTNVKRMLAYSSIAHAGYMLMAAAAFMHPSLEGAASPIGAILAYVVIYLFMNLGAFGVTALVGWQTGSDDVDAFTGLARRAPLLAVPMIICLVSLVGLPPFAGFIGKWWVLAVLGERGGALEWILVVALAVNTLISLYYYMRIVVQMTLRDDPRREPISPPAGGVALVNVCAVMLIVLFVLIEPLKNVTDRYAQKVFKASAASRWTAERDAEQDRARLAGVSTLDE